MADVQQEAYVSMNTHTHTQKDSHTNTPMTLFSLSLALLHTHTHTHTHAHTDIQGRAPAQREGIEQPAAYVPLVREHSFKDSREDEEGVVHRGER